MSDMHLVLYDSKKRELSHCLPKVILAGFKLKHAQGWIGVGVESGNKAHSPE